MAASSSGVSIPASEAVQVLVSSLADDSPLVREASMASLKDIATLNPLLVLECCYTVSRGGRRRFTNMAGAFQVMSVGVQALSERDVDQTFMSKLAKIATAEMISSKELNADWQRAAAGLLVSIGSHLPDLHLCTLPPPLYQFEVGTYLDIGCGLGRRRIIYEPLPC
ncbi:hypothetical protein EUGRSUZ_K02432 [Eucalyptus grandis]|uniref:MROH2B-like N-terminal HEAT-repeats domain-containing protein n=2 Tax=Eucalyptus grandis TaxID=71139 RepID=A0A059A610_EUCGR|nr:hypothetical protein EUGRSUZ_K02432 [Eucalyptus grandis]